MLRRRDVKGSNRREGAEADTAEKLGNDGSAGYFPLDMVMDRKGLGCVGESALSWPCRHAGLSV